MAKIEQTTNSSLNVGGLGSPGTPINVGSGPGGPNVNPNSVPNVQVTPSGDNGDNTNNTTPPEIFLSNGTTPFTYNKSSKSGLEITFTKRLFLLRIKCCTSPMMIHKITPSVDYNQWLKRLDINPMNQPIKIW